AFSGKQVILHKLLEDNTVAEVEGKIEAASEFGIAFREKGKRDADLVELKDIEEITEVPSKPKKLAQKKLKLVAAANVRQHLLARHALGRKEINEMTDEEGEAAHNQIDHSNLGHRHEAETVADEAGEVADETTDEG